MGSIQQRTPTLRAIHRTANDLVMLTLENIRRLRMKASVFQGNSCMFVDTIQNHAFFDWSIDCIHFFLLCEIDGIRSMYGHMVDARLHSTTYSN